MTEFSGLEYEKEALEELEKIKEEFRQSSPEPVEEFQAEADDFQTEAPEDLSDDSLFAAAAISGAAAGAAASSAESQLSAKEKRMQAKQEKAEKKAEKKKKKKKLTFWRVLLRLFLVFFVIGVIGLGVVGYYVYGIVKDAPEINPSNIYDLLSENSVLYDANGDVIHNIYKSSEGLRKNIDYANLPENLKNAFVAIEDKTFWKHNGFNIVRIIGAVWDSAKSGFKTDISGTSTITQQLARNVFIADQKSVRSMERKIREAYYTILIERALSKEQILEAYLNTIYLGYNCSGVGAAARAYFNKDVSELDLMECAALASLPQNPASFALLKRIPTESLDPEETLDTISQDSIWTIFYNDRGENRMRLVLKNMHEQGKITDSEYEATKTASIRDHLNPGINIDQIVTTTYFSDFVVSQVLSDLQTELGLSYKEAYDMLYTGGLQIYSSMDPEIQRILDESYDNPNNFIKINPNILKYDAEGSILTEDRQRVVYIKKERVLNAENQFVFAPGDYEWLESGDLKVYKGKRLNIYKTRITDGVDIALYVKDLYYFENSQLYTINGTYLMVPMKYKSRDEEGNAIIYADFFEDYPDFLIKNEDGTMYVSADWVKLTKPVIQPQSAMVVIENETGLVKGMVGGRGIEGSLLYNRATSPRQTGSSIKPLAVYSTALQKGYENAKAGKGPLFSAAYPLDDIPTITAEHGVWPVNAVGTYTGVMSLRSALENSINTCSVNLFNQLDMVDVVSNLENMGISTLVKTEKPNDLNPASLALGGLTKGVSPYEMCSAFSTFGNYGVHIEPRCYTKITNMRGDVIIDNQPKETKVLDEGVASVMLDILRTALNTPGNSNAKIQSQPTAGKTGTSSDFYDIWFCGLTPKYSASVWIGCDSNVSLGVYSGEACRFWAIPMQQIGALDERGEFELKGDIVKATIDRKTGLLPNDLTPSSDYLTDIFVNGTQPKVTSNRRARVRVCADTGYLATPSCPYYGYRSVVQRPGGISWENMVSRLGAGGARLLNAVADRVYDIPDYYCPIHNPSTATYPVSPLGNQASYNLTGIEGSNKPKKTDDDEDKDDDDNGGGNDGGNDGGGTD